MATMNGMFNGQILVDKLSKLNSSQQSIETLSHWCIFHRKNAKQVVETWDQQFHCATKSQWVSFLYLANDILQNSRRKGSEFVNEFWKVLPDALNNVIENADEFGRNAALRLVDIWEERKVFGSRGQVLKEEILGRSHNNPSRDGKNSNIKLKQSVGDVLEKLISNYECVYDGPVDEDTLLGKCQGAVGSVEKVEKEIGGNFILGNINGPRVVEELQGQSGILRECIEQLKVTESSRVSLVAYLREALHEQELKLERVRNQLQAAQFRVEQAGNICQQIMISSNGQLPPDQRSNETSTFSESNFIQETQSAAGEKEQSAPVKYVQQDLFAANSTHTEEHRKTAAAAVAAKLAASTSSAEMLSYVLSSLASEGVIRQQMKEDFTPDKRPKLDNGMPFMPPQVSQLPTHFPHPDTFQQTVTSQPQLQHSSSPMPHPVPSLQPPPPPPSQPPMPPPPPPAQYMQAAGSMTSVPYSYGSAPTPAQRPPPLPSFPMVGMPPYPNQPNPYQSFQASESGFFGQPPLPATPPSAASRQ